MTGGGPEKPIIIEKIYLSWRSHIYRHMNSSLSQTKSKINI